MLANITFDQYQFMVEYDLIEEDFYQMNGIDWSCLSGQWTDSDENVLDMSSEEVENESRLFEDYINELLKKELLK